MISSTMRQVVYKGVWTYNLRLFCGYLALCPYKASHVQRLWRLFPPALLLPKPPALCLCWQLRVWGYLTSRRFVSIFLQRSDSQSCPVQIKTFCLTGRMVRSARCTYLEPEFAVWAFPYSCTDMHMVSQRLHTMHCLMYFSIRSPRQLCIQERTRVH